MNVPINIRPAQSGTVEHDPIPSSQSQVTPDLVPQRLLPRVPILSHNNVFQPQ